MAKSTTLNKITMDSELKETLVCHGNGALPLSRDQLSIDESRSFKCRRFFKNNAFLIFVFAGIIAGFVIGIAARQAQADADAAVWIGLPGELYMRILTATILPLIICTVIEGTSVGDPVSSGRIGLISFLYIALTNALGGVIGVLITYVFKPNPAGSVLTHGIRCYDAGTTRSMAWANRTRSLLLW